MATRALDRRTLIRGAGGAALALPILEAMLNRRGTALAAGPIPKRYLVCFGGFSLGADGNPPKPVPYVPDRVGQNYDLKAGLAPLASYNNIKDQITVVSGLRIFESTSVSNVPPGGRDPFFHSHPNPLITGMRTPIDRPGPPQPILEKTITGASSDQVVFKALGGGIKSDTLVYRVQASPYVVTDDLIKQFKDYLSYETDAAGKVAPIPPQVSPRAAFNSLFTGFTPVDPAEAARVALALEKRKSILDLVDRKRTGLLSTLGNSDRQRLTAHFDEIRDLETSISTIIPPATMGSCAKLADPGADPPVGGSGAKVGDYDVNAGYSNEDARAKVFSDLIAMAFACDLHRAGSLMYTCFQSFMNVGPIIGVNADLHSLEHNGSADDVTKIVAWHMKHFAYLVAKLRDVAEGAGSLLDNCAVVFLHEGGYGATYDSAFKSSSSHSTQNMACLVAGGAGGLKRGHHIVAPSATDHPGNVLVTAMNAVGMATSTFGEVTSGPISSLIG